MVHAYLDGRVFGDVHGTKPVSILGMHGWGRSREDFSGVFHGRSAVAIDLPGFGLSPVPASAWSTAEYAAALWPIVADLERPRTVVGHSFGGRVAVMMASRLDPEDQLVLVGTPLIRRPTATPPVPYRVIRTLRRHKLVPESVLDSMRKRYGSADYQQATGTMREVFVKAVNESYEHQLADLRCATTIVSGEFDTAAPAEDAVRSAALSERATALIVPGAGHLLDDGLTQTLAGLLGDLSQPDSRRSTV